MEQQAETLNELGAALDARRETIHTEMGGQDKIDRIHEKGRYTIRERIAKLVDPNSFSEVGTFAVSDRVEDRGNTPGDGKIGGFGTVAGRAMAVAGDDITVKRGSSSVIGSRKLHRIFETAWADGTPCVYFGETGGARIPDTLGSEGFVKVPPDIANARRRRRSPMISVICGESFGGSSFQSAFSDVVIQVEGTCLAVTSPRVIEIATGEKIGFEELGGTSVHDRMTGQIDRVAKDEDDAIDQVRTLLGYLPQNCWEEPPRTAYDTNIGPDDKISDLVPMKRTRAYDMRRVLRRMTDDGSIFELKPNFGRSLITAFGRIAGRSVGFVASQPVIYAGALSPDACDKATAFLSLCDANNIPLIFMQDTPGFMVGRQVEHANLLAKAIRFAEALALVEVPRLTVVMRKAFGLAYFSLSGSSMGGRAVAAWPSAEISFMDPAVGVNVVYADKLAKLDPEARGAEHARLMAEVARDTGPNAAAGAMQVDEIINPADTRAWLAHHVSRMHIDIPPRGSFKPLATWPTCY
ncbi:MULTISPECIES: carboxyl transferase domain-containing protein [unclassified Minwuia]|jgi:acetyl-CoA carboxylase carboxyltransferase component|uniref:acyl-CoA carboxylase subunit beta n=1 Tax=unclassified Minwuia TaxID=2618799 RepID=UPI00247A4DB4|nr:MULTISPECIES: carboxyl transferase domain-containing protein [unclassified Minwuia]